MCQFVYTEELEKGVVINLADGTRIIGTRESLARVM